MRGNWRESHRSVTTVTCPICSHRMARLYDHVRAKHGLDAATFHKQYPNHPLTVSVSQTIRAWKDQALRDFIIEWFPHWGRSIIAKELGISSAEVRYVTLKLKLKMLPRAQRLCHRCKSSFVGVDLPNSRKYGSLCRKCCCLTSTEWRHERIACDPVGQHMIELVPSLRKRNKTRWGISLDFDAEYLIGLWKAQRGLCYYTNRLMTFGRGGYGKLHDLSAVSVDRLDAALPYQTGNIVLATWWANSAKSTLSVQAFQHCCIEVVQHMKAKDL